MPQTSFYRPSFKNWRPLKKNRKKFSRRLADWLNIAWKLGVFLVVVGIFVFIFFAKDLPDPSKIEERNITQSTKIYDRTGKVLLYDIHGEEKRTVVPLEQISPDLINATIAAEDANFYNHFGLDFKGIARAVWGVITGDRSAGGGSTITQQFIKKIFFSDKRSYIRKIKEWVLAIELERRYSKDEILSFYLNQIPYGSNTYGIEAAAQTFFSKPAKDLTLAESALLAALPQAPSRLSPYGSRPEEMKARQEYVLDRMVRLNFVSSEKALEAKAEELKFSKQAHGIKAPHFVMYVKEYLENTYGVDYLEKAGLRVYTTLDWDLQQAAETIVSEGAANNWKNYKAYNAALVALDPKTGQILTMVGSRDYFDLEHDGNVNVTIRDRQPGSSFKPFAYATAFKKGYTPQTILFDLKTEFNPLCSADGDQEKDQYGLDCYHPTNYDGAFRGPVTAKQALAQSLNIPSVQMLYLASIEETLKTAKNLGITSLGEATNYGLALVLGSGEVKLLDEVAAYGVFAAEGEKTEKTAVLKIIDQDGNTLEEYQKKSELVLDSQVARQISDILSDNNARSPVFGVNSYLYLADRPVAAKTGTTQQYRDAWTLGYTPSLVAGVWVGNNDNTPMARAGAGIAAAGPLWQSFIKKAYALKTVNCDANLESFCLPKEPETFNPPEQTLAPKDILNGSYLTTRTLQINKLTGQIATDQTPSDLIEEKTFEEVHNILYYVQRDDPLGNYPASPDDDPQYKNWESAVINWLKSRNQYYSPIQLPQNDSLRSSANLPKIKITSPSPGQIISQTISIQTTATAPLGLKQIDFFLDDVYLGSSFSTPHIVSFPLPKNTPTGQVFLRAVAYDNVYNRQEAKVSLFIDHK